MYGLRAKVITCCLIASFMLGCGGGGGSAGGGQQPPPDTAIPEVAASEIGLPAGESLLAYYRLNEEDETEIARDSSGNGADAGLVGDRIFHDGYTGNALNLRYTYIVVPDSVIGQLETEVTLAFYAKGDNGLGNGTFLRGDDADGNRVLLINLPWEENLIFDAGSDGSHDRLKGVTGAEYVGVWNHWAVTKDAAAGEMKVYLNGELVLSADNKNRDFTTMANLLIGAPGGYNGAIDELAIYNACLGEEDVRRLAGTSSDDTDEDGIANSDDPDDDNDGVADTDDLFRLNPDEAVDTDDDGVGDSADPDDDNDTFADAVDLFPLDPEEFADDDGDGIGNAADPDDDNDGFADVLPTVLPKYDLSGESYTYEHIHTVPANPGVPGEALMGLGNTLSVYGGHYYVLYTEQGTGRPKILKINEDDTSIVEDAYMEAADYVPLDDGHSHFSMEVDRHGHLHIVGDMHNHPAGTNAHLPERLKGMRILYWRTEVAEDITSFKFYGDSDKLSPQGVGFTYPKLFRDKEGALYMTSRQSGSNPYYFTGEVITNRGAGLTRLDPDTWRWTHYGDYPKAEESPLANYKHIVYEPEPMFYSTFYIKTIPSVAFDNANRLHFAAVANNNHHDDFQGIATANGMGNLWGTGTDLIYMGSDDLSIFRKADWSATQLPAGADPGDGGDVVFTRNDPAGPAVLGIAPKVATNRFGNPVVMFSQKKLYDVQGPGWSSGATWAEWDGAQWKIHTALGPDGSIDWGEHIFTDQYGVMTVAANHLYRMWEPEGEGRYTRRSDFGMPHGMGELSQSFTKDTGDLLGRYFDQATQQLTVYRIRIDRPYVAH